MIGTDDTASVVGTPVYVHIHRVIDEGISDANTERESGHRRQVIFAAISRQTRGLPVLGNTRVE
jgi:hypothetical protein